jgi:hypothetical protein
MDPMEVDMKEAVFEMLGAIFSRHVLDSETTHQYFDFFVNAFESDVQLEERMGLAWDNALIAFSYFIHMNMNNLDLVAAADAWHEYMPIWTRVEMSDAASVVLADFIEMRNPIILDPDVLAIVLMRMLRGQMWQNMAPATRDRMLPLIKQLVPEFQEVFLSVWNEKLSDADRRLFAFVLQGTEIELTPPSASLQEMEVD